MAASFHPVSALLLVLALAGCAKGSDPRGDWVGDVTGARGADRLEITIDSIGSGAVVSLRGFGLSGAGAVWVTSPSDSLVLLAGPDRDRVRLAGRVRAGRWDGLVSSRADTVPFTARRLARWTPADRRALEGTYRTEAGALVGISPFTEFGAQLFLLDYRSGRLTPLYPISADRLLAGHSLVAPVFPADTVALTRGPTGRIETIRLAAGGGTTTVARRDATVDQEIAFSNREISLGGTLTLPAGPPPYPAVVLVHGSNAQPRGALGPWHRFFAGLGFAVLAYDKRGTGRSTGDWKQADFAALAGDVLAGVRFLATRPEIRPDRIGLWGISQAGWLLPMVAAEAPTEIAFLAVHAGTGTTVREQGILNLRDELRASGLPPAAVSVGVEYRKLDDRLTETGKGIEEVEHFYQSHRAEHSWLWAPDPPDAWFRTYYRMVMATDPAPYWRRVTCPVLLFFGELDVNVPPAESWPPIQRALQAAGNTRVNQFVLPRANHLFLEAKTGGGDEYPSLSRFVPGYFDRMANWLAKQGR